jgi:hypothetical protein
VISPDEINGLMKAVNRPTLRDEILQIVSRSPEPICCNDIYKKSAQAPDTMTLSREVHLMTTVSALLEVAEKKPREGFREVAFYRLTALGRTQLNTPSEQLQPPAADVNPITAIPKPIKETSMNPSELNAVIYNKIVEHPGIKLDALIKHALSKCPEATEKQVKKTISNMTSVSKKIRAEGKFNERTFHLNTAQAKPAKVGKVVTGAEAAKLAKKHTRRVAPPQTLPAPATFDPEFRFAFGVRKDGGVAICKEGISITLSHNEMQTILSHTAH